MGKATKKPKSQKKKKRQPQNPKNWYQEWELRNEEKLEELGKNYSQNQ